MKFERLTPVVKTALESLGITSKEQLVEKLRDGFFIYDIGDSGVKELANITGWKVNSWKPFDGKRKVYAKMKSKRTIKREGLCAKCGGDVYTFDEFMECVRNGSLSPYDGNGYFHNGENETNRSVWDKDFSIEELKKYPYVCWYNK